MNALKTIMRPMAGYPRYQRLRDQMVALIAAPDWRPGEAIPTERALSQSYGVAVGTV